MEIYCAYEFTLGFPSKGLFGWGTNQNGQLGIGTWGSQEIKPTPIPFFDVYVITKVVAGRLHVLALTNEGSLFSWGDNQSGQLGLGHDINESIPQQITSPNEDL